MMTLGIGSFTYSWAVGVVGQTQPHLPLNEMQLIDMALANGVQCVQIADNMPLHKLPPSRKEKLRDHCRANGVRLELGARGLTGDHLNIYIDLCKYFESSLLRFVVDSTEYEPSSSTIIKIIQSSISQLEHHGITLAIENHDRFKAAELASIIEAIDHVNVGICLDCVNSLGAGEGLEYVLGILAPYTVNLHLKDFQIRRLSHNMGFTITGAPAGKGMISVLALLKTLSHYQRCQTVILEQWVPFENDIEHTCNVEQQWATEGIRYLSSLSYFEKSNKKLYTEKDLL